MRVLHIISSLEQNGAARQLRLLAQQPVLDPVAVCVLGRETPAAGLLRRCGWAVHALDWTRRLDLRAWWRFRRLVKSIRPDVVHTWDAPALRTFALGGAPRRARLVASGVRTSQAEGSGWSRRRLERIARIVARGPLERKRWIAAGVSEHKVPVVPPGANAESRAQRVSLAESLKMPGTRWIACAGALMPHKGFYDALWAFDILRYFHTDLHLAVIGEGPERPRLERLARQLGTTERVRFLGWRADAAELIAGADVVWAADREEGGVNVVLEAMAAGRPVVASDLPALAEIVVEGQTGFLVPRGDKPTRDRRTRLLLDDADLRRRLGEAGRQRAASQFAAHDFARRLAHVYASLAA